MKRRDRHDRGLRGPVTPIGSRRRHPTAAGWFEECLTASLSRIGNLQPGLLDHIDVGVEEVPPVREHDTRVALAAAIEASPTEPARVVVYRRPLEHRSSGRRQLRRLVHRTVVEQLAALTGRTPTDIDPLVSDDEDD